ILSVAALGIGLFGSEIVQRSLPSRRRRAQYRAREPRAAHLARARRGRARSRDHSGAATDRSLYAKNRPRHAPAQTAAGAIGHSVGQTASHSALCRELLRDARRIYGADPADHAAIDRRVGCHAETIGCPETNHSSKCRAAAIVASITLVISVIFVV